MISDETRLQYASGYLELGMTKEARAELREISSKRRDDPEVLSVEIRLLLSERNWKRMASLSNRFAKNLPDDPFGWINWAYALREMEKNKEAKDVAILGLELHPESAILWFNLACYCSLLGLVQDASDHLDKAISLEKSFEAEAVDDPDLDNLWKWIRSEEAQT